MLSVCIAFSCHPHQPSVKTPLCAIAPYRSARQAASGLAGQLSGPLGALLAAAAGGADGSASTHHRLSEDESLSQQLQERAADLAARLRQLGAARSGLRSRLQDALDPGASAENVRRLQQASVAGPSDGAIGDEWWWAEEEYSGAAVHPGYSKEGLAEVVIIEVRRALVGVGVLSCCVMGSAPPSGLSCSLACTPCGWSLRAGLVRRSGFCQRACPSYALPGPQSCAPLRHHQTQAPRPSAWSHQMQDVSLAPLASDMLVRMLALARDALDMAIALATPSPADWPAAYGAALPQLLEPLPYDIPAIDASEDPSSAGALQEEAETLPAAYAEPTVGTAAVMQQPPLPAGEPPVRRRRLRQSTSYDDPSYYDESYDDSEYDYRWAALQLCCLGCLVFPPQPFTQMSVLASSTSLPLEQALPGGADILHHPPAARSLPDASPATLAPAPPAQRQRVQRGILCRPGRLALQQRPGAADCACPPDEPACRDRRQHPAGPPGRCLPA